VEKGIDFLIVTHIRKTLIVTHNETYGKLYIYYNNNPSNGNYWLL